MFDKDIVIENLKHICCAIDKIIKRFAYIDSETVFIVCNEHIPRLKKVILKIINDLE